MALGALIGAGIGAAGSLASTFGAKKAQQDQMSQLLKYVKLGQMQAGTSKLYQQNLLQSQKKTLSAGLDRAGKLLGAGRYQAKVQAKDVASAQQGQAKSSMLQRGLYNTTVYDTVSSGISASLAGQLGQIDASYDQLLSGFEMDKTNAMLGIADKEMALEQWYAQAMMGSHSQMADYIAGGSAGAQQFDMGGFGQLWGELGMGSALGTLFGGGGGGGGGATAPYPPPGSSGQSLTPYYS